MLDVPHTPAATLRRARDIARQHGLHYVYTGNVHDLEGSSTYCPTCRRAVVERDWYELGAYRLTADGRCIGCGAAVPGRFDGPPGGWGRRRVPVTIGSTRPPVRRARSAV